MLDVPWCRPLLAAFAVSFASGCGSGRVGDPAAQPEDSAVAPAASVDDTTLSGLIAAAGDHAPLVLVVEDRGWAAARDGVLAAFADGVPRELRALSAANDGPGVVAALGRSLELELPPPNWNGRNAEQPIVVALYEAPFDGPPGAAIARMSPVDGRHMPIRHQVVIPATEPSELAASLRDWVGAAATDAPALVAGLPGAIGLSVTRPWPSDRYIAIIPRQHHVRVVVLDEGRRVDDASELRPFVDVDVVGLPPTPALMHLTDLERPVGALIRPWQLRAFGAWQGMLYTQQAADAVSVDQRNLAVVRGTSISMVVELLTPNANAEFDDWSFALHGDAKQDIVRLTGVASLTPKGAKVWTAAGAGAVAPLGLKDGATASAFVSLDLPAMIAAASAHELPDVRLGELARNVQECGLFCPTFAALRWPFAALKTFGATPGSPVDVTGPLSAFQIATPDGSPSKLAAAVIGNRGVSLSALRAAAASFGGGAGLQLHEVDRGGDPVLLVGAGVDPRTVFDLGASPLEDDVLATFSWDRAGPMPKFVRPTAVDGEIRLAGRALVAEVIAGPSVKKGAGQFRPDYAAATWQAPRGSEPASKAARCLRDAVSVTRDGFDGMARGAPEHRATLLAKTGSEMEPLLACARADAAVRPAADALEDMFVSVVAEDKVSRVQFDGARGVLKRRCEAEPSSSACARLAELNDAASAAIPKYDGAIPRRCDRDVFAGGVPLMVDGGKVSLAGRNVTANAKAIAAALVEATPVDLRFSKSAASVTLVASGDTTMASMAPVFEALAATQSAVRLPIRDAAGDERMLVVFHEWASKLEVEWKTPPNAQRPDWLDEEPPPEPGPAPSRGEEGKMGRPSAKRKSGLYAMKGPKDAIPRMGSGLTRRGGAPLTLALGASGLRLSVPGSPVMKVTSIDDLRSAVELFADSPTTQAVRFEPAADARWKDVVDVLAVGCGSFDAVLVGP